MSAAGPSGTNVNAHHKVSQATRLSLPLWKGMQS